MNLVLGRELPFSNEIIERWTDHDQDVYRLLLLDTDRNGIGGMPGRWSPGDRDLVSTQLFELGAELPEGSGQGS